MSTEPPTSPYEFADRDLAPFVVTWLEAVQRDDAASRGLLKHVGEGYDYGGYFLMANIGPEATNPAAGEETLLLYAVLAAYQNDGFQGAASWRGEEEHVMRAFGYARALGAAGVASVLLKHLAERSTREPVPEFERMLARSMNNNPARRASHDREMASIGDRDIRAAALLDDSLSIDDFFFNGPWRSGGDEGG